MKAPLERLARHAYAWLFASLLLTLAIAPVLGAIESRANWHDMLIAVNLILAVLTVTRDRGFRPLAVLAFAFVVLRIGAALPFGLTGLLDWSDALWLALILYILVSMVRCALRPGPVDSERIFAALSTYLLAGLAFATGYWLMDQVWPGSFGGAAAQGLSRNDAVYFSFVTLATLGYGDVVPVSPPARGFALLEAVGGQLYIAVLIARLVSLTPAPRETGPTRRARRDEARAKTSQLSGCGKRAHRH